MACYEDNFTFFLYVGDVRTSQKTHLWASTPCYMDSFTYLYVDGVCTSHETPVGLHRDSFTFLYVEYVRTSEETPIDLHGL
jgi:hypothetical protein